MISPRRSVPRARGRLLPWVSVHPFLIGLFPILALWAGNVQYVHAHDVLRSALAALAMAGGLLLIIRLATRSWEKAAVLSAAALIFFFSYGHVYGVLKGLSIGDFPLGRHRYMVPVGAALFVLLAVLVVRGRGWLGIANQALLVAGLVLVIPPLIRIASWDIRAAQARGRAPASSPLALRQTPGPEAAVPDIYYIIVDGYGRSDVLQESYGFDNTPFLEFLEQRGFYVAESSHSNYGQTLLSFASSLNLEYIQDLPGAPAEGSDDRIFLDELIRNSLARRSLADIGYQFVAFETTFNETSIDNADVYYIAYRPYQALVSLNAFESQVLSTSLVRFLLDAQVSTARALNDAAIEPGYEGHRNRILYTLATLPDVADLEGDYFAFVHILAPHPPFVFGPNGERIHHTQAFSLKDTGTHFESPEEYIRLYRDQATYLDRLLTVAIDEILQRSDTPPIMIIQGDHGPGAHLDWDTMTEPVVHERYSILNAYLFPDDSRALLYPSITPVNSLRVLFRGHFGAELPLLEDRVYFSQGGALYRFVDATGIAGP